MDKFIELPMVFFRKKERLKTSFETLYPNVNLEDHGLQKEEEKTETFVEYGMINILKIVFICKGGDKDTSQIWHNNDDYIIINLSYEKLVEIINDN